VLRFYAGFLPGARDPVEKPCFQDFSADACRARRPQLEHAPQDRFTCPHRKTPCQRAFAAIQATPAGCG
jgi:hypothetical protein